MHVAIVTAGGAGMFCGSCMHDNTLARALHQAGCEVSLIPTYTPIRVDEQNVSESHVMLGGINMYLDHTIPLWNRLPRWLTRWLDSPKVISLATRFGVSNDASELGPLTIDLLRGHEGPNRREVEEFVGYLCDDLQPDIICFSNALLSGPIPTLRKRFSGPVVCLLQGDDIFLDGLIEPYRSQALEMIHRNCTGFDRFLTHSDYYREHMRELLDLPNAKFERALLGIDLTEHSGLPEVRHEDEFVIGYFARICPEKGLHRLIDAFRIVRQRHPHARLKAAGYLGKRDARWFTQLQRDCSDLEGAFEYAGSPPTRQEKVEFLKSVDVISVPTEYQEPKGLYVLEALANGTPVVLPAHGAFPELIDRTNGGLLCRPGDASSLAASLESLINDRERRLEFARSGHQAVHSRFGPEAMAGDAMELFGRLLADR